MILEVPEEDVTILVKADSERRENRYDVFISEDFRLRPVIGYTIILTCEKNCPTSQIASNFQQIIFTGHITLMINFITYIIITDT